MTHMLGFSQLKFRLVGRPLFRWTLLDCEVVFEYIMCFVKYLIEEDTVPLFVFVLICA
jgi:hypothetical protein